MRSNRYKSRYILTGALCYLLRAQCCSDFDSPKQAHLAEMYITYLILYWQSFSQPEGAILDQRLLDTPGNFAPAANVPSPPPPPGAYLDVLFNLLSCLLHSCLFITIIHFYGNLNMAKFALFCVLAFLGVFILQVKKSMEIGIGAF